MAHKLIKAVVLDAAFVENFVKTESGEDFVGSVTVTLRDIDDNATYVKALSEEDLNELTGSSNEYSPLELIRIAEYIQRFPGTLEMVVSDESHLVTNEMVLAKNPSDLGAKAAAVVKERPTPAVAKPVQKRPVAKTNANFGFDASKAKSPLKRKRNPDSQT